MPSIPPAPPCPPQPQASFFSGRSVTMQSVVSSSPAMDAAFCSALRVTFAGRWPFSTDATYREFLSYFAERFAVDERLWTWTTGRYQFFEYRSTSGAPMLTYAEVKGMPHANIPEMSWLTWDLFFSRFARSSDGGLLFMGRPV